MFFFNHFCGWFVLAFATIVPTLNEWIKNKQINERNIFSYCWRLKRKRTSKLVYVVSYIIYKAHFDVINRLSFNCNSKNVCNNRIGTLPYIIYMRNEINSLWFFLSTYLCSKLGRLNQVFICVTTPAGFFTIF